MVFKEYNQDQEIGVRIIFWSALLGRIKEKQ
jgi:hypothetical protein